MKRALRLSNRKTPTSSGSGSGTPYSACPAENVIEPKHITRDTKIAAPGIPLGVQGIGLEQFFKERLLHDSLQIGVATMLWDVL